MAHYHPWYDVIILVKLHDYELSNSGALVSFLVSHHTYQGLQCGFSGGATNIAVVAAIRAI